MTRLARTAGGRPMVGSAEGFVPLTAAAPACTTVLEALQRDPPPDPTDATASPVPAAELAFGPPLASFGKLWGIGLNFAEHATDLDETAPDEPASFMKPSSAVVGPGGPVRLPDEALTDRVTAEGELAVVIGRTCTDVAPDTVDAVIAGYVPVIDLTAEDVLERNPRFLTRAKSFDTFLVVGPWIRTPDAVGHLTELEVRTVLNDEVRARNVVGNMHVSPAELVAFHSRVMTLEPGDLISTGTPGAVVVEGGDRIRAEVDGVGTVAADVVG